MPILLGLISLLALLVLFSIACEAVSICPGDTGTKPPSSETPAVSPLFNSPEWRDSQWNIGDISFRPSTLKVGQPVEVCANIYVPGIVERYGNAYFSVNGQIVAENVGILIYGDEIIPITFSFVPIRAGSHELRIGVVLQDSEPYSLGRNDLIIFVTVLDG